MTRLGENDPATAGAERKTNREESAFVGLPRIYGGCARGPPVFFISKKQEMEDAEMSEWIRIKLRIFIKMLSGRQSLPMFPMRCMRHLQIHSAGRHMQKKCGICATSQHVVT